MRILVVDDDRDILQLVSIHLKREGYTVYQASDAEAALALLEHQDVDLAVVDVMMPGMNGFELTRVLAHDMEIPVILLTAKGQLADKEKGFLAGSEDYLVKPFEPKELLFRVAVILRDPHGQHHRISECHAVSRPHRHGIAEEIRLSKDVGYLPRRREALPVVNALPHKQPPIILTVMQPNAVSVHRQHRIVQGLPLSGDTQHILPCFSAVRAAADENINLCPVGNGSTAFANAKERTRSGDHKPGDSHIGIRLIGRAE